MPTATFRSSHGGFLSAEQPTTNFYTIVDMDLGVAWNDKSGEPVGAQRAIFGNFDLTNSIEGKSLVGTKILSARLRYNISYGSAVGGVAAWWRRVIRAGVNMQLLTWLTYDGTNPWGTAGASNTTSDVTTENQVEFELSTGSTGAEAIDEGFGPMVVDALGVGTTLMILGQIQNEAIAGPNDERIGIYFNPGFPPHGYVKPELIVEFARPGDSLSLAAKVALGLNN